MADINDPWAEFPDAPEVSAQPDEWGDFQDVEGSGGVAQTPPVTPEEENPGWLESGVSMAGQALTMLPSALNKVPYVRGVIPDFMAGEVGESSTGGEAAAGGVYSIAQNAAELGAAGADWLYANSPGAPEDPAQQSPVTDLVNEYFPDYQYSSNLAEIGGDLIDVAGGFVLGNKVTSALKAEGLATKGVEAIGKVAPKLINGVTKFLGRVAANATQGVGGMSVTMDSDSDTLVTGDNSLVNQMGMGKWIEGLPMDDPQEAQNVINGRINLALDALITGGGISAGMETLRTMYEGFLRPTVIGKIKTVFSPDERLRNVLESMGNELKKITPDATEEQLKKAWERLVEVAGNVKNQKFVRKSGIAGVDDVNVDLDTATTFGQGMDPTSELDRGIKSTLDAQAKQIGQKGYEATAVRQEGPVRELNRALTQTEEALGGPKVAQQGAVDIQEIGKQRVQAGKTQKKLKETEAQVTKETITENVNRASQLRREEQDRLYDAIPDDAKADPASITKIIKDSDGAVPKDIVELIKDSDGSFKYLNNKVRPEIVGLLEKLKKSTSPSLENRETIVALQKLRDNIDGHQISELNKMGRKDVVEAAKKAKEFHAQEIGPNEQGLVGDLGKIERSEGLHREDILERSAKKIDEVFDKITDRHSNARLRTVLSSDEGGRTEELITRLRSAKDKIEELGKIEEEVFGNKLREFYDSKFKEALPDGPAAFDKLFEDKQALNRVKYIMEASDQEVKPAIKDALKYGFARKFREALYTGNVSKLGGERLSSSGVRGVMNNDALLNMGREIFKDTPEWTIMAEDVLKLADSIGRSAQLKAAPVDATGRVVESAKAALRKVLNPIYGPLSHRSLQINTLWGTLLEVIGPQGAMDRVRDGLLADPEALVKAYKEMAAGKTNRKLWEKNLKIFMNTLLYNEGEQNEFRKKMQEIDTENQTEKALDEGKKK